MIARRSPAPCCLLKCSPRVDRQVQRFSEVSRSTIRPGRMRPPPARATQNDVEHRPGCRARVGRDSRRLTSFTESA